jgi:hypothetical protein
MCISAVENDVRVFRYCPQKFMTQQFCAAMLKKDADIIQWIPKKYITENMCDIVIQKVDHYRGSFNVQYLPAKLITRGRWINLVSKRLSFLKKIPDNICSSDLYLEVAKKIDIDKFNDFIEGCKPEYLTVEIFKIGFERLPKYKRIHIPEKFRTVELAFLENMREYSYSTYPEYIVDIFNNIGWPCNLPKARN